ncbi:MAG: hypothetical protein JSW07_03505, partial [bacterium]
MSIGREARLTPTSLKWVSVAVGLLIAVVGFLCHLNLELKFERLEVYNQYNVFFDADPNVVLYSFANLGDVPNKDPYYRRQLAHPNVVGFFSVPIRALVKVLSTIFPNKFDERYLQRQLAFLIVPISAALFYLVLHRLFLRLGFSLPLASLLTLLVFVSFSQVLFGSIPELFAISNLAI